VSLVRFRPEAPQRADVAHLAERHLAKVEVAGSSPVIRSSNRHCKKCRFFVDFYTKKQKRRAKRSQSAPIRDFQFLEIFIKKQKYFA
jgi:hypothetical protein